MPHFKKTRIHFETNSRQFCSTLAPAQTLQGPRPRSVGANMLRSGSKALEQNTLQGLSTSGLDISLAASEAWTEDRARSRGEPRRYLRLGLGVG